MDRNEWLEERRKVLTASDIASVLGIGMRSPIQVYVEKVHPELAEESGNEELLEFGNAVEPVIAGAYERATGTKLDDPGKYKLVHHPKHPEIACTIDRITADRKKIVELKWQTMWADKFGDPGTDQVPEAYVVQCATQMAVWGCDANDLATMRAGPPLLVYPLYRDMELENMILERAREWFDKHIRQGIEPPITGDEAWSGYLARKYPTHKGEMVKVDDAATGQIVHDFIALKKSLELGEKSLDELKNSIKAFIAERDGLLMPDGTKITWRKDADSVKDIVNYQAAFEELCDREEISLREQKDLLSANTDKGVVTRKGARKFLLKEPTCPKLKP